MTRVLVVDDEEDIRAVLDDALQQEGFHVSVARNGKEALDLLQREQGWVVLLDVHMPVVDGYEVVRRLRENPVLLDDHRVMLMTAGRAVATTPVAALDHVVLAIVPKPFELDTLLEVVQRLATGKETSEG
jgi:CheY-like chemotaxis protein